MPAPSSMMDVTLAGFDLRVREVSRGVRCASTRGARIDRCHWYNDAR
jgi:hypothetical protein